jgi:hypothetical protein
MGDARATSSHGAPLLREGVPRGSVPLGRRRPRWCLLLGRRAVTYAAAALFLIVYFPIGSALVFWSMAPGIVQGTFFLSFGTMGGVILLARHPLVGRPCCSSSWYVVAWVGLVSWNVAEAHRHMQVGA